MSTRICTFGSARDVSDGELVAGARAFFDVLDEPPDEFLLWLQPESAVKSVRWFGFVGNAPRSYVLDAAIESMYGVVPELIVTLHDDQRGVHLFEHYVAAPGRPALRLALALLSDGPYVGACAGTVTADHAQRGFTHEQLRALHERPPESLSEREARAIMDYESAIAIGLRQTHPEEPTRGYLAAWHSARLVRIAASGRLQTPQRMNGSLYDWSVQVHPSPDSARWRRAGLVERR
jgi:hypothetical protein